MIPNMIWAQIDLLPTEEVLVEKPANCVIRLKDYHLSRMWFRTLMPLIGMTGKEAIGGMLSLTNYRLIFHAHEINRVQGAFSIFLPTICGLQNTSVLVVRKIRVVTQSQDFEFVIWGIPMFLTAIRQALTELDDQRQQDLRQLVATNVETCVENPNMRQVAKTLIQDVNLDLTGLNAGNSFDVTQLRNIQELFLSQRTM